jgi:chaperonin cofactor prefoldin
VDGPEDEDAHVHNSGSRSAVCVLAFAHCPCLQGKVCAGQPGLIEWSSNMPEPVAEFRDRISQLQQTAQQARVQALRLLGQILIKQNKESAGTKLDAAESSEHAALQARYAALKQKIEDLETKIDMLQADEHEHKYGR